MENSTGCREGAAGCPRQLPLVTASRCVTPAPAVPLSSALPDPHQGSPGGITPCTAPAPRRWGPTAVTLRSSQPIPDPSLPPSSEQDAQGTFCCFSPGCQSSDGGERWGKPTYSVCKTPSSLASALLPLPTPEPPQGHQPAGASGCCRLQAGLS